MSSRLDKAKEVAKEAAKGGVMAGAGSIITGVALTTTTTTSWILFTTTATVVAPWILAGCVAVGAVAGAAGALMKKDPLDDL